MKSRLGLSLVLVLSFCACGRPKASSSAPSGGSVQLDNSIVHGYDVTSLSGVQWELTKTNDPGPLFTKLDSENFIILQFDNDYTLKVFQVINGQMYDTPVLDGQYNADPADGELRIAYGTLSDTTATTSTPVSQYTYTLDHDTLHLTDSTSHYTYDYTLLSETPIDSL